MPVTINKKKKVAKKIAQTHETVQHKNGAESVDNGTFEVGPDAIASNVADLGVYTTTVEAQEPCIVSVEMGNTVNTGNYESSKFNVGVSIPSSYYDIDKTYDYAQNWVNDRLGALNEELQEQLGS